MARKAVANPSEAAIRVRAARLGLGITVAEAARRCGIGHQAWTDLERGRKGDGTAMSVSLDRLWLIAESLGIDPHELDPRLASVPRPAGQVEPEG